MLWNQRNLPKQVVRYMEAGHLDAPSILDIPQMEWDADTKACVLDYMFSGENFIATSMKGAPKNAFTGCDLVEALANFGDGCWQWRGDLPLYIRDYKKNLYNMCYLGCRKIQDYINLYLIGEGKDILTSRLGFLRENRKEACCDRDIFIRKGKLNRLSRQVSRPFHVRLYNLVVIQA